MTSDGKQLQRAMGRSPNSRPGRGKARRGEEAGFTAPPQEAGAIKHTQLGDTEVMASR